MSGFRERIEKLSPKRLTLLALELQSRIEANEKDRNEAIAIVGIGCRIPGAGAGPEAFWDLLTEGRDAISETPGDRWDVAAYFDPNPDTPGHVSTKYGSFLPDVDLFDAPFFSIARREAVSMDPQQRLLLEVCWEALENAGQSTRALSGTSTGVFLGISTVDYYGILLRQGENAIDAYLATGTAPSIAAGRISYALGLQGPSIAIDTACSASLVAVHLACQSLRTRECRIALAGGVNLILSPDVTIALSKAHMMAGDGRCKAFDARADGFVRGEGCGMVVLKRLSDAEGDRDNILAVIRGSAVNQDGRSSGLTAPNGTAQEALLRQALGNAGVQPEEIGYVEAHGTGTSLGDPIEAHALAAVLARGRSKENPLVVGSVKTNVGHLEAAAGVAGLIKTVLALQHEEIPRHLHFQELNPHIDWGGAGIEIPVEGREWRRSGKRRIAGVSAFGFSGTNAHVIVEEAPERREREGKSERPLQLLTVTGRSAKAVEELGKRYGEELEKTGEELGDICYTANAGRAHFEHRKAVVGGTVEEVRRKLGEQSRGEEVRERGGIRPVFLFSGQGSQYAGMGKQLYETQAVFRRAIEECEELLRGELQEGLREVLWGGKSELLDQTAYTQPALFALEYGIAEVWKSWGILPGVVLGHSVGEYVAACVAGAYSVGDGLKLIAARARLMQAVGGRGGMVAVRGSEERVREALEGLEERVTIGAFNGRGRVVISGYAEEVGIAEERLKKAGIGVERLRVSHGFHSPQMGEMEEAFEREAKKVRYGAGRIKMVSSVTGKEMERGEMSGGYWRRQVREPVRFAGAMEWLQERGQRVYVEVGPGTTLLGLGREWMEEEAPGGTEKTERMWLASVRKGRGEWEQMLESLGRLYEWGAEVNWEQFDEGNGRRRVAWPTYPFERQRYWVNTTPRRPEQLPMQPDSHGKIARLMKPSEVGGVPDDWYYKLAWESKPYRSFPQDTTDPRSAAQLAESLDRRAAALETEHRFDRYALLRPELNALCGAYIAQALRWAGGKVSVGSRIGTEQLAMQCSIAAKHRQLFRRLLEILAEDGVLSRAEDDRWIVSRVPAPSQPDLDMRALRARHPEFDAELEMTARCAESLGGVLQGKVDSLTLLFPGGSTKNAEKIYSDSPGPRVFNRLVADVVAAEAQSRPEGVIRVLEVGAGTGGTTIYVAPVLPAERTEYVYTDVSSSFKAAATEKFRRYPFFRYQSFDIENEPASQGFEPGQFDIVIAANVLHATANLRQTMERIRTLLSPGGLVVLLEGTYPERWVDLTFGLTEGWWRFRDRELRPGYPLISREAWLNLLTELGFQSAAAVQLPGAHQVVFHARTPAVSVKAPHVLIVPDSCGIAAEFAATLSERGATVNVVTSTDSAGEHLCNGAYDCVVHMSSINSTELARLDPDALMTNQSTVMLSVLATTQAMLSAQSKARLWLVTSGAQQVIAGQSAIHVTQSPVWGLGRTIALEQPGNWGGLLDVDPAASPRESAAQLMTAIMRPDGEDQSAIRNGTRYVPRLMRTAPLSGRDITFRADKMYLLTGGLGELGVKVARWMIERGARRLVLAGRSPLPDRSKWSGLNSESPAGKRVAAVRSLEQLGAEVQVTATDICDAEQAAALFASFGRGSLKGIVHLAAALDGSSIKDMTSAKLLSVLEPKTKGTWILHKLSEGLSLDFFVMFSSWASIMGTRGLGHYAAANQFLDVFAHYRASLGLPAVSVTWGTWDKMHASPAEQQGYARGGLLPMRSDLALAGLGQALQAGIPQPVIASVDWSVHKPLYEAQAKRPILEHVSDAPKEVIGSRQKQIPQTILETLDGRRPQERRITLIEYLAGVLAPILAIERAAIDPRQPMTDFGLDSLMALEFKNRIGSDLGVAIPTVRMLQGPSLDELASEIEADLRAVPTSAGRQGERQSPDRPLETASDRIRGALGEKRRARIVEYLTSVLAPILGIATSSIHPALPVTDYGLDSLMALEFKNGIGSDLNVNIPTVRMLQGPSLEELASHIAGEIPEASPSLTIERSVLTEADEYPLCYGQQAQWFGHELMPDSSTFNVAFTAKASPHLSWESFERALAALTARHPALRTIFVVNGEGQPVQRVLPSVRPEAALIEAASWSAAELREAVLGDFHRSFDLTKPMLRVTVYRQADGDVILLNLHHIIVDAWSVRICFEDLKKLYAGELKGVDPGLEPVTAKYRDFVQWQRNMVTSLESERLWQYWQQRLDGELPALQLRSSKTRPAVIVAQGECIPLAFEPGLPARLRHVAREYKATGYSFLLAAFQVLLYHCTGQSDIIVGTSTSGRDNRKWANVVGYFVNLLPLRAALSGSLTFAEHLVHTRATVLDAIDHEAFPFPLLVERLRLRRDLARSPVFQAFFNFLTDRSGELGPLTMGAVDCAIEFGSSTLRPCIIIPQQEGQSEIVLQLAEFEGQIVGNMNYNSHILDRATAESMAAAYCRILDTVLRNPNTTIEDLAQHIEGADSAREEIVL